MYSDGDNKCIPRRLSLIQSDNLLPATQCFYANNPRYRMFPRGVYRWRRRSAPSLFSSAPFIITILGSLPASLPTQGQISIKIVNFLNSEIIKLVSKLDNARKYIDRGRMKLPLVAGIIL